MGKINDTYRFVPFVGTSYEDGFASSGKKLLLLGESSFLPMEESTEKYLNDGELVKNYIKNDINENWMKERKPEGCFVGRLQRMLTNKCEPEPEEIVLAWNSVAYVNYIPFFAGDGIDSKTGRGEGAGAKKWSDHWKAASEHIKHILDDQKPDRVLVLGKTVWNHINHPGKYVENQKSWRASDDDRERGLWAFPIGDQSAAPRLCDQTAYRPDPALATWVYHPSWGRDNWKRMRNVLDRLIEFSP